MFAEAISSFQCALALQSESLSAGLGVVSRGRGHGLQIVERMSAALRQLKADHAEAADLHHALGKAFDDLDDLRQAMGHYDAANGSPKHA